MSDSGRRGGDVPGRKEELGQEGTEPGSDTPVLRRDRRDRGGRGGPRDRRDRNDPRYRANPDEAERGKQARPALLPKLLIALAFALPFAWDLAEAIADLAALLAFADAAGHPLNSYAWLVLGAGILTPIAAFTTALLVGWPRGPLRLAACLGAALAATAAVSLTLEALLRA